MAKRFARVGVDVLRELKGSDFRVYVALKSWDIKGCFPTTLGIALDLRMDPNHVRRAIRHLEAKGAIIRRKGATPKGERWIYEFPPVGSWGDGPVRQTNSGGQTGTPMLPTIVTLQNGPPSDRGKQERESNKDRSLSTKEILRSETHTPTACVSSALPHRERTEPGMALAFSSEVSKNSSATTAKEGEKTPDPLTARWNSLCKRCGKPIVGGTDKIEEILDLGWCHSGCPPKKDRKDAYDPEGAKLCPPAGWA